MPNKTNPAAMALPLGAVPNPDPTVRTIEQLQREVATTREILEARLKGDREVIETRLGGNDTAVKLLQTAMDKIPLLVKDEVAQLKELHGEVFGSLRTEIQTRFDGIDTQFQERDKRTEQLSLADKTAIAAALQAQKEAAGATNESNSVALIKMETNFTKLLDQLFTLQKTGVANIDEKINDVKSRLDRGEGRTSVSDPAITDILAKMDITMRGLVASGNKSDGQGVGQREIIAYVIAGGALVISFLGMK